MNTGDLKIGVADILLEFLEVAIHNILYVKKLYPDTIYIPKKKYGVTVYQAIHPEVVNYIKECLKAVGFHARRKQLKRLFVCFERNDIIIERFVIDVLSTADVDESDSFLVKLEETFRAFMLRLHSAQIYLNDLASSDSTFSIRLETTSTSSLEFNENPSYENMDVTGEGAKTKTLAVFENVLTKERQKKKKKFKTHMFSDEDSSQSDSELVIDDENKEGCKRKRSGVGIRLKEEVLNLKCQWDGCSQIYTDTETFSKHLLSHVEVAEELSCKWTDCPDPDCISTYDMLARHLSYHGYLTKLVNIGDNALKRNNFPECSLESKYKIKIPDAYCCEWEYCDNLSFNNIFDFLSHVESHVMSAPSGKEVRKTEVIECQWGGCDTNYSTRYKLADHLRAHTRERVIACPQCMSLFSSRTTFSDHRKRQLKTDMRSYQCSQCLKLFSIEKLLSDHMRSHINQYKCTLCDMTSTKPSMLAKHYRFRHMNIRPFACQLCSKTFVTKSNLNTHLLIHQDTPFKCDQCEFGCKSKVGLRNHMTKVHGLETPFYECQVCKDRFKRGDYLTYHLIKQHKFHWPSGHSRFRYRKDSDGIHRLQTVRYESLEVTEQMIKSESMQSAKNSSAVTYNVIYDKDATDEYKLTVVQDNGKKDSDIAATQQHSSQENISEASEEAKKPDTRSIIIIIEDLDEKGNVVSSRELDHTEILLVDSDESIVKIDNKVVGNRSMPVFEYVP